VRGALVVVAAIAVVGDRWTGLELRPWQQDGMGRRHDADAEPDETRRAETRRDDGALAVSGLASPQIRAHAARREEMLYTNTTAMGVNCQMEGTIPWAGAAGMTCLWLGASGVRELALAAIHQCQAVRTWHQAA
jgi:hypothetical protein